MRGNDILKVALLGTDKYTPQAGDGPGDIGGRIIERATDKEDAFLKIAATTLLYEEAGQKPIHVAGAALSCPAEVLPVINDNVSNNVASALSMNDDVLLHYFIHRVNKNGQVLMAGVVPAILNKALENKKAMPPLICACGETGKWLCNINPDWRSLISTEDPGNIWETGTQESRKAYLLAIRAQNPAQALELLDATIEKENAANRLAFTEVLQVNLSLADEPFLEKLLKDKSQKVKDAATLLLQGLQGSVINKQYLDYLLSVMLVKEERYMLISKRKEIVIKEDLPPGDSIFSTGIDKVSSSKDVPDHIYIIGQLLRFIDPAILSARLGLTDKDAITLLLQHKHADKLLSYMAAAAGKFANRTWALHLLNNTEYRVATTLDALDAGERQNYYGLFIEADIQAVLNYVVDDNYTIMPLTLAKQIAGYFAKQPYTFTPQHYRRLALHFPGDMLTHLKEYADTDSTDAHLRYFKAQAAEMMRVIEIRNNSN